MGSGTRNKRDRTKPTDVDHQRAHFVFLDWVATMRGSRDKRRLERKKTSPRHSLTATVSEDYSSKRDCLFKSTFRSLLKKMKNTIGWEMSMFFSIVVTENDFCQVLGLQGRLNVFAKRKKEEWIFRRGYQVTRKIVD